MQRPRSFREHGFPGNGFLLSFPKIRYLSGEKQHCCLFPFSVKNAFCSGLHAVNPDIHVHGRIFIVIRCKDLLAVFIKFRIAKNLLFQFSRLCPFLLMNHPPEFIPVTPETMPRLLHPAAAVLQDPAVNTSLPRLCAL